MDRLTLINTEAANSVRFWNVNVQFRSARSQKTGNKPLAILVRQFMKTLICLLFLAAFSMNAADLTGKWTGKFDITTSDGEEKPDTAVMTLKIDGSTVTGTAGPNEDKQWTIQKGKLESGKLTFEVAPEGDGNSGLIVFDLTFDGTTIRGSAAGTGDNGDKMTAKVELKRAA